jgi:hypothetical protein
VEEKMTKAEEIKKFSNFLKSLPTDSYLWEMFNGTMPVVETTILNDTCHNFVEVELDLSRRETALESKLTAQESTFKAQLGYKDWDIKALAAKFAEANEKIKYLEREVGYRSKEVQSVVQALTEERATHRQPAVEEVMI